MEFNMKKIIALVIAVLMTTSLAYAEAGPRQHKRGHGKQHGDITKLLERPHVVQKLGITDEQVEKIKSQAYATKKQVISLNAERELAQLELNELMDADSVDKDSVVKAVEKVGALNTSLHKARVLEKLNVIEILGKEKYDELKAIKRQRMRAKHDGKHERGKQRDKRGFRGADIDHEGEAPPWMLDEMPPPEPEDA